MEIEFTTMIWSFINIAILIAIFTVIIKGIKKFKGLISKTKQIDEKLDTILNKLEK